MTGPSPSGSTPDHRRSASGQLDRRVVVASAAVLIGSLLMGILLVAVTYDPGPTSSDNGTESSQDATPGIIPTPNSGSAPDDPGDRGGWEQLALLGIIVTAVGLIVAVVVRGGGRARANRAAWRAAAEIPEEDRAPAP